MTANRYPIARTQNLPLCLPAAEDLSSGAGFKGRRWITRRHLTDNRPIDITEVDMLLVIFPKTIDG